MTRPALRRVWGLTYRHLALFRHSWPRLLELMYFPVLEMMVWGLVTRWLATGGTGTTGSAAALGLGTLLGGTLLWQVVARSQMGFALSFLEEVWSRNLGHIAITPLRPRELVAALMGISLARTLLGVVPAVLLAWVLYGFGLFALGPVVVLFWAALLGMGWAVALGVVALILRHGQGAEGLAWSVIFGLAPLSAVFYPVASLPGWLQPVSWLLPATHVFEGMRAALLHGTTAWGHLGAAFALNALWLAGGAALFLRAFHGARVRGALLNMGE